MIKITSGTQHIEYKSFNFPVGEKHVKITHCFKYEQNINIHFEFERNEEIIELLLIVDALKRMGINNIRLDMPYVPFARQDRVMTKGEPLSIKVFTDLINSCGFEKVVVMDVHSDITSTLLNNCVQISQSDVFFELIHKKGDYVLICPDGGALKKICKIADLVKKEVVTCEKHRDVNTGKLSGFKVNSDDLKGRDCVIVDDICDGGGTFVAIAKILKELNAGNISLNVTHGFFTKGLEVFDGIIDEIYTRKGKIK